MMPNTGSKLNFPNEYKHMPRVVIAVGSVFMGFLDLNGQDISPMALVTITAWLLSVLTRYVEHILYIMEAKMAIEVAKAKVVV